MIPRIIKINGVENSNIRCTFNNGEYRVIDLSKFVQEYKLQDDLTLDRILSSKEIKVEVDNGTLTFPDENKEITLKSGKVFNVKFDLDPIMLYNISDEDLELNNMFQIGRQLKRARKQAGLTQEQLANRVGTSKAYISRIENNRTDIALKTLRRIIEVGLEKRLLIAD